MKSITNLRKIKKSKKGITLVALIVTIIVLLILVGVTIATISRRKWNTNKSKYSKEGESKRAIQRRIKINSN